MILEYKQTYNKDPFKVLNLKSTATKEEVIQSCKKLRLKHHPDKGGTKLKIQEINDACKLLLLTFEEPEELEEPEEPKPAPKKAEPKKEQEELKYKVMNNPTRQLIQKLLREPLYKTFSLAAYTTIKNNFSGKNFLTSKLEKAKKFNYEPDIKLVNQALKIWDSPEFRKNLEIIRKEAKEKKSREEREKAERIEKEQNSEGWQKYFKIVEDNKELLESTKRLTGATQGRKLYTNNYSWFKSNGDVIEGNGKKNDKWKKWIEIVNLQIKKIKETKPKPTPKKEPVKKKEVMIVGSLDYDNRWADDFIHYNANFYFYWLGKSLDSDNYYNKKLYLKEEKELYDNLKKEIDKNKKFIDPKQIKNTYEYLKDEKNEYNNRILENLKKKETVKKEPKRNEKIDDLIFKIENNPNYTENYNTLNRFLQKTKDKNIFPLELTFAFTQKQNNENFKELNNDPKLFMDFMAEIAKSIKDNNDLKFNILKKYDKKPSNMSVKNQNIIMKELKT